MAEGEAMIPGFVRTADGQTIYGYMEADAYVSQLLNAPVAHLPNESARQAGVAHGASDDNGALDPLQLAELQHAQAAIDILSAELQALDALEAAGITHMPWNNTPTHPLNALGHPEDNAPNNNHNIVGDLGLGAQVQRHVFQFRFEAMPIEARQAVVAAMRAGVVRRAIALFLDLSIALIATLWMFSLLSPMWNDALSTFESIQSEESWSTIVSELITTSTKAVQRAVEIENFTTVFWVIFTLIQANAIAFYKQTIGMKMCGLLLVTQEMTLPSLVSLCCPNRCHICVCVMCILPSCLASVVRIPYVVEILFTRLQSRTRFHKLVLH
eukprot:m.239066 g.239066  ORF g.239066 m.239066 type:complete len:327 (-) comp15290_c0_seq6:1009-1989(-)